MSGKNCEAVPLRARRRANGAPERVLDGDQAEEQIRPSDRRRRAQPLLERHRPWEPNVVLEVDVLVELALQLGEPVVEPAIRVADVDG